MMLTRLKPDLPAAHLTRDKAEMLAIEVLSSIATYETRLGRFIRASGLDPAMIRTAAATPAFLLGVLDYVAADEWLLTAFAVQSHTHPATVMAARAALAPSKPAVERRPTGPLRLRCEHCGVTEICQRREHPHVPPSVITVALARCSDCGGAAGGPETWLDARGNEVG
jgi:hypothetical protein